MLLARAFDLAWERYYTAGQERTVSKQVAKRQLATFVVAMLRSGVREEKALAACGVLRSVSLTPGQ
jgi:hypothetical protein